MNAYEEGCWHLGLVVKKAFFKDFKRAIESQKEIAVKFNLAARAVKNIINKSNRGNLNQAFQAMKIPKHPRGSVRKDAVDWKIKILKDKIVKNIQVLTHFSTLAMRKEYEAKLSVFKLLRAYKQQNTDVAKSFKAAFQAKLRKWNKVILRQNFKKWKDTALGIQKMEEARINYCRHLIKKKFFEGWVKYTRELHVRLGSFQNKIMKVYLSKRILYLGHSFEAIRTYVPRMKLTLVPTPSKRPSILQTEANRLGIKNDASQSSRRNSSKGLPTADIRGKQISNSIFAEEKSIDRKRQLQISHMSSRDSDEGSQANPRSASSRQEKSPQNSASGKSFKYFPADTPKKSALHQWTQDAKKKK